MYKNSNNFIFDKTDFTEFLSISVSQMANIEESLSLSAATNRRRKGTSIGSASTRSSPKLDTVPTNSKEMRSALQDREAIMQR